MKRLFLLLAFITLPAVSHASLLLEPYIGFNHASIDDGTNNEGGNGYGVGGRIGFSNLGLQLALDVQNASADLGGPYKNTLNTTQYSAFVGFNFPILLRVFAGYTFKSDANVKFNDGLKEEMSDGKGYLVGASFTALPLLDINLEYRNGTYGTTKTAGVNDNHDTQYSSYLLSVSIPFTL